MAKTKQNDEKEIINAFYNLPEGYIKIMGQELSLMGLPHYYEMQAKNIIDNGLDDIIQDQNAPLSQIVLKVKDNLSKLIEEKLPEVVKVIGSAYGLTFTREDCSKKMTTNEMLEVVIIQMRRNLKTSKVVNDFFISKIKKIPKLDVAIDLINAMATIMNVRSSSQNAGLLKASVSDTEEQSIV